VQEIHLMASNYDAPLDLATTESRIESAIRDMREKARIVTIAIDAMKPQDGKPMSKRLATAVSKVLPEFIVNFDRRYGMYYLAIWAKASGHFLGYENRIDLHLGYDTDSTYRHDRIARPPLPSFERYPDGGTCGNAYPYTRGFADSEEFEAVKIGLADKVATFNAARIAYQAAIAAFAPAGFVVFNKDRLR
jgi:hypothetical protein